MPRGAHSGAKGVHLGVKDVHLGVKGIYLDAREEKGQVSKAYNCPFRESITE
jgi:hypothetical protein